MKQLQFIEMLLLSTKERSARRIPFHPRMTVIKGANDTGKSSLLKSIYQTIGADPPNQHRKWKEAAVVSSLKFSLGSSAFRMIRRGGRFGLFDGSDRLVKTFASVTHELAPHIADMLDGHMILADVRGNERQVPPAYLYLPFYIDQDKSWSEAWQSFDRLRQFPRYKRDVALFHTGVFPSKYYVAKSKVSRIRRELAPIDLRMALIESMLKDVEGRIAKNESVSDIAEVRDSIDRLLSERNDHLLMEERLRRDMAESFELLGHIDQQILIAARAKHEIGIDRSFAGEQDDVIRCPMCHAEYSNGFAERFGIAVDEGRCDLLLAELEAERRDASAAVVGIENKLKAVRATVDEMTRTLAEKREIVAVQDLLQQYGQIEMKKALQGERDDGRLARVELLGQIDVAENEVSRLTNRDRKAEIVEYYRSRMAKYVDMLNVPNLVFESYKDIVSVIKETGSDQPRALLAYYFAILQTIAKWSTATFCPVVIDSPRQQDQDDDNYRIMLEFIKSEAPAEAQLVLAVQGSMDVQFDGNVIELDDRCAVLRSTEWEAADRELQPLIDLAGL